MLTNVFDDIIKKINKSLDHPESFTKISVRQYGNALIKTKISINELSIFCDNNSIIFKPYLVLIQYENGDSYRSYSVYLPTRCDKSFFNIKTESEFFQLSLIEDLKFLKFYDIESLNTLRELILEMG